MEKTFYVYILATKRDGVLYIGFTSNLSKRIWEHKNSVVEGFTKNYGIKNLVYYEIYDDAEVAILREKKLKKWRRQWKVELIEAKNPQWLDLYDTIVH